MFWSDLRWFKSINRSILHTCCLSISLCFFKSSLFAVFSCCRVQMVCLASRRPTSACAIFISNYFCICFKSITSFFNCSTSSTAILPVISACDEVLGTLLNSLALLQLYNFSFLFDGNKSCLIQGAFRFFDDCSLHSNLEGIFRLTISSGHPV